MKVLHAICQQSWKTQQWPQDWKRSVFIPIPKKGSAKECSNYRTIVLISHASKVMSLLLNMPTWHQIQKTQQWPQDWKGQFSFQSQKEAVPKNAQTTAQLHSSRTLESNAQNSLSQALTVCESRTSRCSSWI